jgi:translation initiation factor IF-3
MLDKRLFAGQLLYIMTNYRRRRNPPRKPGKQFNINERVKAEQIRLIDEEGNMIGIMSMDEARAISDERELDIIEINPKAEPPICKLMSFSKFKYLQSKSESKIVGNVKPTKTLRVSVRVSDNDLAVRARKADAFLQKGMKVKLQVKMTGREKAHPEVAEEGIYKFIEMVSEPFDYETEPKQTGDSYFATLKPGKKSKEAPVA